MVEHLRVSLLHLQCLNQLRLRRMLTTSSESQAFGRVHRLGQKKRTYLVRIAVKNSVDTRIMNSQSFCANLTIPRIEANDTIVQVNKEIKIKMAMKDDLAAEIYLGLFGRVVKGKIMPL
jgi:hypothetical protein